MAEKKKEDKYSYVLLTMTDSGEAYIMMLNRIQTVPTIIDRRAVVWTMVRVRTARMATNMISTTVIIITLILFPLLEKTMKRIK